MEAKPILLLALLFIAKSVATKQYVFRLDDVQDYWQRDTQIKIIDWCMKNGMAISLGPIGIFFGKDALIVNKVKDCLRLEPELCEVFNHGLDATIRLGDLHDLSRVQSNIAQGHNKICSELDGYQPKSFVPHQNSWSETVATALQNLNYDVISASVDEGMEFDSSQNPMRMPQQTATATYRDGGWIAVPPADILASCQATHIAGDEACVIMAHPQEFEQGKVSLRDLAILKRLLDEDGWTSRTFSKVAVKPDHSTPHQNQQQHQHQHRQHLKKKAAP